MADAHIWEQKNAPEDFRGVFSVVPGVEETPFTKFFLYGGRTQSMCARRSAASRGESSAGAMSKTVLAPDSPFCASRKAARA